MLLVGSVFAATLAGHVYDADGAPIDGATVTLFEGAAGVVSTTTDADGAWTASDLAAGYWRAYATAPGADDAVTAWYGGATNECDSPSFPLDDEDEVDGVDFPLARGATVQGTLLHEDGTAVVGASVFVYDSVDATGAGSRTTTTGDDGGFFVGGLVATSGVVRVAFEEAGVLPQQYFGGGYSESDTAVQFPLTGTATELGSFTALPGITVTGTITGPDGPVADGVVYVYAGGQAVGVTIASDGVYTARGLPPGDVLAWADVDGLGMTYWPGEPAPTTTEKVGAEGAVVTQDIPMPAESVFTLQLLGDGDLSNASATLYDATYTVGRVRVADDDGVVTFDGLWPGDYSVSIGTTDTWQGELVDETFAVDGATDGEVELEPAAHVTATLVDEDGAPARGAYGAVTESEAIAALATVEEDGTVRIDGLGDGVHHFEAWSAWSCPSDPGWVRMWWDDARTDALATPFSLTGGEETDLGEVTMLADDDHDGMGDTWETEEGLDPTRDDAGEDPDGDGYTNLEEWQLDTHPATVDAAAAGCGCTTEATTGGWAAGCGVGVGVAAARRRRRGAGAAGPLRRA